MTVDAGGVYRLDGDVLYPGSPSRSGAALVTSGGAEVLDILSDVGLRHELHVQDGDRVESSSKQTPRCRVPGARGRDQ
jgi:hypothetical protein